MSASHSAGDELQCPGKVWLKVIAHIRQSLINTVLVMSASHSAARDSAQQTRSVTSFKLVETTDIHMTRPWIGRKIKNSAETVGNFSVAETAHNKIIFGRKSVGKYAKAFKKDSCIICATLKYYKSRGQHLLGAPERCTTSSPIGRKPTASHH